MTDSNKAPGFFLQCIVFVLVAIPAFSIGMVLAAVPCFGSTPNSYCNMHGGGVIVAGMGLGVLLAIVAGIACVKALRKPSSDQAGIK